MPETITIYTDGSCKGNPGPGGWAAILIYKGEERVVQGNSKTETTNNRMEMMAIIKALDWLHKKSNLKPNQLQKTSIHLHSDSNLIIQTLNQGWKRKANTDLWAKIDALSENLKIKWTWVKAHAHNKLNNRVDELAFAQATKAARA